MRDAYAKCAAEVETKYGTKLTRLAALGISGMMHGYLAFDEKGELLVPFRTWQNTITGPSARASSRSSHASCSGGMFASVHGLDRE